ncbi:conserved hypothetical protein [Talaromyces marneffei ATCC 18224]|uniref:Amidohydrolase-related domain-containing protein n=1 Tax=Talaromyces marneffei (strain ATCC 18224 / CBS 334.59 / QM 7333) TaxID=441960 RepID=B6Q9X4_TALMQ|nr:conserved hypothetical protein [Talaromyces marneffei ATCC 18224]
MRVRVDQEASSRLPQRPASTTQRSIISDKKLKGLKASLLIPGRGEPIKDGAVVIDGPKIAWVGDQSAIPTKYEDVGFKDVPVLMPGLWDCHTHFQGMDNEDDNIQVLFSSAALQGARAAKELETALMAGVTTIRETVRLMVRRGATLIKICATGGVGSLLDDPEDAQFSPEEIKAIVDEAARTKRIVAAHCHGKEGIMNALNNGVHTIEHGSYLDEEVASLMRVKNAIFVSTRLIVEEGLKNPNVFPPSSYQKLLKISDAHKKAYALAIKSGVKVALGTDWTAGENGKELAYAVEAGMSPLQAIEACTARCPETLGSHFAPLSGQLKEGYDADVIAVASNPLDDIKILGEPEKVTHVWKGGKLYKGSL